LKIAIAGAGSVGAYLYRLLRNEGNSVDLYDIRNGTTCGLTPCAWGTSLGFHDLIEGVGLKPEDYLLDRPGQVFMDGVQLEADLMTFDKPRLIRDLLHGAEVIYSPLDSSEYERVIDATGLARAFLPPIEDDIILPCMQYRVRSDEPLENKIKLGRIGYAWCFPLSEGVYHVGCGDLRSDPHVIMEKLGWLSKEAFLNNGNVLCECEGDIRLTSPRNSQPFVAGGDRGHIWGVGEAIGCVAPLAGDGIVPGMKSAQILVNTWDDPNAYTEAILKEFHWMTSERRVIDKLRGKDRLGLREAWVLKKNSRRMGFRISLREATMFIKKLR
jgi:flavin-dependent dehydrogenase